MSRISEWCSIVQCGIRSMDSEETAFMDRDRVFFAKDIAGHEEWIPTLIGLLPETVYITLDVDVLDPSIMPSTGTPEPGGLHWYPVLSLLRSVFRNRTVAGFDICEHCPGPLKAPDFLTAKLLYKMLSYHHSYGNG
jgi:agmatinase